MNKSLMRFSYIYLLIGTVLLFFFNGKWILPIAAFLAPVFLIRFLRFQKPFNGFLLIVLACWISNIFVWKGMMPMSGFFYYFVALMMSVFTSLTFSVVCLLISVCCCAKSMNFCRSKSFNCWMLLVKLVSNDFKLLNNSSRLAFD